MGVKVLLVVFAVAVGVFALMEGGLRLIFGLGNPPLYIPDAEIGYLLAPNQHLRRFGNRMRINQYSMRSDPLPAKRPASTLRILLLGDSIANGAWWTDQDETISALIESQLRSLFSQNSTSESPKIAEVFNASANSWGPRNQLAYLRRFGLFEAQVVVLLLNTDDLFATAPTSLPVGRDRNYPARKPPLALTEIFTRVFVRPKPIPGMAQVNGEGGDRVAFNLEAIREIKAIATQANAQFILAMTPLLREIGEPGPRDYEHTARKRLQELTNTEQIPYIDFLPLFNGFEQPEALYRDHIHLSPQGNQLISDTMSQSLNP
ncbi:MAG: SGNH/GDSL hydrolase family protein [Moorea sp. SIO2B7]|nr:SGNH/GDSL hydrolase family protein [Moorena sp. SIO2B7]